MGRYGVRTYSLAALWVLEACANTERRRISDKYAAYVFLIVMMSSQKLLAETENQQNTEESKMGIFRLIIERIRHVGIYRFSATPIINC